MPISFNEIPNTVRVPFVYVEIDNTNAVQGPTLMPHRNLVIGQRLAGGTVDALVPTRVTNAEQAKTYFGQGSMLAAMLTAQLSGNDSTETWAVALDDDAAGVEASGSITVGGEVAAGTIALYIAGTRLTVGVSATDTPANVATKIATTVTAEADLIVTATVNNDIPEQVDVTARHKGRAFNQTDIRHSYYDGEALPTGLTLTIADMADGISNPDVSDIWTAIGDEHYTVITFPYTDAANLVSLETELADRFGPLRMIEAHAFTAATGTHAELGTLGDSRNSPHLSIMNAAGSPTPPWEWAATVAGVVSYHANIDPARPFQTLALKGVMAPKQKDRFTLQENNLLLFDGISTHLTDAGGVVRIQRMITTYKTNPQGAGDISYLDVNTMLTLSYLRYDFRTFILVKYPRHKLRDDGTRLPTGQAIITPKLGKAEAIARFKQWEQQGLVEGIDQFIKDVICERNSQDPNRLDWMLPPDLVNQFRVGGVKIGFLL